MDSYTATELSYKNGWTAGYEQGLKDAVPESKWIAQDETRTKFMCKRCEAKNYEGHEKFCPNCGARMKG